MQSAFFRCAQMHPFWLVHEDTWSSYALQEGDDDEDT